MSRGQGWEGDGRVLSRERTGSGFARILLNLEKSKNNEEAAAMVWGEAWAGLEWCGCREEGGIGENF